MKQGILCRVKYLGMTALLVFTALAGGKETAARASSRQPGQQVEEFRMGSEDVFIDGDEFDGEERTCEGAGAAGETGTVGETENVGETGAVGEVRVAGETGAVGAAGAFGETEVAGEAGNFEEAGAVGTAEGGGEGENRKETGIAGEDGINGEDEAGENNRGGEADAADESGSLNGEDSEDDRAGTDNEYGNDENNGIGDGADIIDLDGEDTASPDTEEALDDAVSDGMQEKADLRLLVTPDEEVPKAGSLLAYEVLLENCGEEALCEIFLESIFPDNITEAYWEEAPGLESAAKDSGKAILDRLEKGEARKLLFYLQIPEEQDQALLYQLSVSAKTESTASGEDEAEETEIKRSAELETEVRPLTVDFTVKKTADRSDAAPGDTITYQICIRNTGERTLHSVLTTERFLVEGMEAHFLEKEGVTLDETRTKALIPKIEPGTAFGLLAEVILPGDAVSQEIVNEVTVVTSETGERTVQSSASVQVFGAKVTATEPPQRTAEPMYGTEAVQTASPKTMDGSATEFWAAVLGVSLLIFACSYRWRFPRKQ